MARPKVHTGARAILKINEQVMVYALSVQWDIMTDHKVINTVDNPIPEEIAPTNIDVRVTCSTLRVPKESASVMALQPTILNSLHQAYVSIEIRDRGTNDTILYVPKALLQRRTGAVASRSIASETWVLRGIGYWDERTPEAAKPTTNTNSATGDILSGVNNLAKKINNIF